MHENEEIKFYNIHLKVVVADVVLLNSSAKL